MKNLFLLIFFATTIIGCEKAINITQPTIIIQDDSPQVFDVIKITLIENADIEGNRVNPDYFEWSIKDKNQNVIYSNFPDSSVIVWTPDSAGYFLISVKIGYDKNKSITALKDITIKESTKSLQKKLIGKWTGNAESMWGAKWQVDLKFDEFGHYIGKGYNLTYENMAYVIGGPFQSASYIVDYSVNVPPSEDVPCNRFLLNKTIDYKGYGKVSTSTETRISNTYSYNCNETDYIDDLEFINNEKGLLFTINPIFSSNFEWYIKYNLTRVEE
jgi:hypothetical protein